MHLSSINNKIICLVNRAKKSVFRLFTFMSVKPGLSGFSARARVYANI